MIDIKISHDGFLSIYDEYLKEYKSSYCPYNTSLCKQCGTWCALFSIRSDLRITNGFVLNQCGNTERQVYIKK
jgi:hypothetical protein